MIISHFFITLNPMLNWNTIKKPIIGLSPMADLTDLPFSLICKEHGAPIIFREMVSSEALVRGNEKTLRMAEIDDRERPLIQQIFGRDPKTMAEAAKIIEERFHPDGIDINMGCPVYNIVSGFNGASLIRDPDRASRIVEAVKSVISVPLSIKTRLGWSQINEIASTNFLKRLQDAGADLITIHGRTKEQGYAGKADWKAVAEARETVPNLPVLVNGDIIDTRSAKEALLDSGADGFLIGRGALGNPWIFHQMNEFFSGHINSFFEPTLGER
ncbi:MAG TPA: tRNA-dihydrouridine synthase family protein, partial [Patescibacteria group bacterium]|nr:tRNA-dihydrouridine synthase family protein [Patescibacteria group bacterium]